MADTHARTDDMNHRKRSEASGSPSSFSGSHAPKKRKLEDDTLPEANPNTMEAVREKNKALELDLKEKNRRIAYLTHKCEALFRARGLTGASFRCLRRQWLQLLDELRTAVQVVDPVSEASDEWKTVLESVDAFGTARVRADELNMILPEWFLTVVKDVKEEAQVASDVSLPADDDDCNENEYIAPEDLTKVERDVHDELSHRGEQMAEILKKLLAAVAGATQDEAKAVEYAHLLQDKRVAIAEALSLKDQLETSKTKIADLERDVEYKETERHRACRDYDRLSKYMEQHGGPTSAGSVDDDVNTEKTVNGTADGSQEKLAAVDSPVVDTVKQEEMELKEKEHAKTVATLRENMSILSTKLYIERGKIEAMRREMEKLKASEMAWKNIEATLLLEHRDQLQQLRDEKAHLSEEYAKIRHKAKDMDHHMTEKWQKKISKIQADMSKAKSQMDEVNLKNVSLREKISYASTYRDQLTELKAAFGSIKRENSNLKAQVEREKGRADRAQASADKQETQGLTQKVALLEQEKQTLQQSYHVLTQIEGKNANEKLSEALKRLAEVEAQYQEELRTRHACSAEVDTLRADIEERKAAEEASREENDALVSEIETMTKEMESMRHTRKKMLQQIDEKRNSCKKLHTLLSREEQAKSHCFEELAAARLQVSSLSTVHKHQTAFIEASKESLQAKESELEKLKEHVNNLEAEREAAEADKRKVLHDAEVAKNYYTTTAAEASHRQQLLQQEKKRPCDKCETYRHKLEKVERQLQSAKTATATGELSDLERFELRDLQRLVNCSVCQDRRKNVIISKCFHMFCKECVENNLKSRNRKCPTCKKMFGHDDVKTAWFT